MPKKSKGRKRPDKFDLMAERIEDRYASFMAGMERERLLSGMAAALRRVDARGYKRGIVDSILGPEQKLAGGRSRR